MARHMWFDNRSGSFVGGTGSAKTDFGDNFELIGLAVVTSSNVASETGSLLLDSGKGLNWDTLITTNTFTASRNWYWTPTHRVVLCSGDELGVGVSGSTAVWYYNFYGEHIR